MAALALHGIAEVIAQGSCRAVLLHRAVILFRSRIIARRNSRDDRSLGLDTHSVARKRRHDGTDLCIVPEEDCWAGHDR